MSKKESILTAIEDVLESIVQGDSPPNSPDKTYENSIMFIDRQYSEVDQEQLEQLPKPWVIINNEAEHFSPLPGGLFENKLLVDIVGFVELKDSDDNLDTLLNSLQRDIFIAILDDVTLRGTADYVMPVKVEVVPEMINPYGGFVISLEITYVFRKTDL